MSSRFVQVPDHINNVATHQFLRHNYTECKTPSVQAPEEWFITTVFSRSEEDGPFDTERQVLFVTREIFDDVVIRCCPTCCPSHESAEIDDGRAGGDA